MPPRTVIRVNHVTRAAAAGAVVARLIVCSRQRHRGVEQSRLLQAQKNRVSAQQRPQTALAEFIVRLAGFVVAIRIPYLAFFLSAALKHAQNVSGLGNLPSLQRFECLQHTLRLRFFRCWWWRGAHPLWRAVSPVTLSKARVLFGDRAVVIKRRAPQETTVRHHAGAHGAHFARVASSAAAGFRGDAQVAGIHETHIFGVFLEPIRRNTRRSRRRSLELRETRLWMSLAFRRFILR